MTHPSLARFEVASFSVMVTESPAIEQVSVGLIPTGPATARLPNPVLKTALRPACPAGSNDWRTEPNSRGSRLGKPDGERLNTEVSLVADQLLIPPGPARRKSVPKNATSKRAPGATGEGLRSPVFFKATGGSKPPPVAPEPAADSHCPLWRFGTITRAFCWPFVVLTLRQIHGRPASHHPAAC